MAIINAFILLLLILYKKSKFTNVSCGKIRFEPTISKLANLQYLTSL